MPIAKQHQEQVDTLAVTRMAWSLRVITRHVDETRKDWKQYTPSFIAALPAGFSTVI
jgi:hypothetical protein